MNSISNDIVTFYKRYYPDKDFVPLSEPNFFGNEKKYVVDCVDTGWVSTVGKYVTKFQDTLAQVSGSDYIVPTVNGTAALHLALVTLGVGPDDEVICPDISFVATAASIAYTGADIMFLDVDRDTLGLSAADLERYLKDETEMRDGQTVNRASGKRVAAVVGMHNIGFPFDIDRITMLCERYGVPLVEDAAEALGSSFAGKMCGTFGTIGMYSFNGNKIITTGAGGALATQDTALYEKALHLSTTAKKPHPYEYIHDEIGYNYRLPNINAAIGLGQLEQFSRIQAIKQAQYRDIKSAISNGEIEILEPKIGTTNHWFIVARTKQETRDILLRDLNQSGIMCRPLWSQISKMDPYKTYRSGENPIAAELAETVICLPNTLSQRHLDENTH